MLLSFNLSEIPYYTYISGAPADTAAYKNRYRTMIGYNYCKYGYTEKKNRKSYEENLTL